MEYIVLIFCISKGKVVILHIGIWNTLDDEDTANNIESPGCGRFT